MGMVIHGQFRDGGLTVSSMDTVTGGWVGSISMAIHRWSSDVRVTVSSMDTLTGGN